MLLTIIIKVVNNRRTKGVLFLEWSAQIRRRP